MWPGTSPACSISWCPPKRPPDSQSGSALSGQGRGNYDLPHVRPHRLVAAIAPLALLAGALSGCGAISPNAASINQTTVKRVDLNREMSDITHSARYVALLQSQGGQVAG